MRPPTRPEEQVTVGVLVDCGARVGDALVDGVAVAGAAVGVTVVVTMFGSGAAMIGAAGGSAEPK
jgi:uncharacterized RDD family membrane protein YckC